MNRSTQTDLPLAGEAGARRPATPFPWRGLAVAAIAGLLLVLFHIQGNTVNVPRFSGSIFLWMAARWNDISGTFSHGWLVPLVAASLAWSKRRDLAACPKRTDWHGLVVVAGSLLLHFFGNRAMLPRISIVALVGLLWGIPYYLAGRNVARILLFPCSYLFFCVPLNFLNALTFPLRKLASAVGAGMLNGLGIACVRTGTTIRSTVAGDFVLDVADPCSGLKYILAITALAALYAYLTQKTLLKKWILFIAAVPMAVAGNVTRVVAIGIAARFFGPEAAMGLYHDFSGYVVFGAVIILMTTTGSVMNAKFWSKLNLCKDKNQEPT